MNRLLMPLGGKRYKVFLVEEDDDDRERVMSGLTDNIHVEQDVNYADVPVDALLDSAKIFRGGVKVTLTLNLIPNADGTYFVIENFLEEDDEDEYEPYPAGSTYEVYE